MTKILKIRPYLIKKVHHKNMTDVTTFKHVELCNIIWVKIKWYYEA